MKNKDPLSLIEGLGKRYKDDISEKSFFGYPMAGLLAAEQKLSDKDTPSVAYFSMEYGIAPNIYLGFPDAKLAHPKTAHLQHDLFSNLRDIDYYVPLKVDKRPDLPIYSGGLGVLAGDTVKSSADLGVSMAAIGVLWHQGYFKQSLWFQYGQVPEPVEWNPDHFPGLVPLKTRVTIDLLNETVHLKLWKYYVYSRDKTHAIPLILLDANLPENTHKVSQLTAQLYRSDDVWLKILQRVVLGVGGMRALQALGYEVDCYHLNEGHAAFAFVETAQGKSEEEIKKLAQQFKYTCHTPVVAGHDRFDMDLAAQILPGPLMDILRRFAVEAHQPHAVNLTHLAMSVCSRVNAVSQKHGDVMRIQYTPFREKIQAITNGVHHPTWMTEPVAKLLEEFGKQIGPWRDDPLCLKNVEKLKDNARFREGLWAAHQENKTALCRVFGKWKFREDVLTVAWARRFAGYKRPNMLLHDLNRLLETAKGMGQLQIILAGKAHPNDRVGYGYINEILNRIDELEKHKDTLRVLMLDNYDTYWGKALAGSVDIWLNNPLPPFEASGTSGMKAIANGVLQLSTLDGWVVEAAKADIGMIFGYKPAEGEIGDEGHLRMDEDCERLHEALRTMGQWYAKAKSLGPKDPQNVWVDKMIHCLAQAGYFSTHRMVREYQSGIWALKSTAGKAKVNA